MVFQESLLFIPWIIGMSLWLGAIAVGLWFVISIVRTGSRIAAAQEDLARSMRVIATRRDSGAVNDSFR